VLLIERKYRHWTSTDCEPTPWPGLCHALAPPTTTHAGGISMFPRNSLRGDGVFSTASEFHLGKPNRLCL
jgi:hypothetical protein